MIKHYWRSFVCFLFGHQWKQFERDLGDVAFDCVLDASRYWQPLQHPAVPGSVISDFENIRRYTSTPKTRMLKRHKTCMRCYKHESLTQ